jgi:sec-independent protein translocase protein TatC
VISQTLLAFPMWILFELGIVFSRFFQRRRQVRQPAEEAAASAPGAQPTSPAAGASRPSPSPPGEGLRGSPSAGPGASSGHGGKSGGDDYVGRDVDGGDPFDSDRYRPMTAEEMEAELDAIEAEEASEAEDLDSEDIDSEVSDEPDAAQEKLQRVKELRDRGDVAGTRKLLYEVLEDGDDDQRRVARNILEQLDAP